MEEKVEIQKEEEKVEINNKEEPKIEVKEKEEQPKKEITETKPTNNLKGKKSKKEPRVKPEKEKEKEKEKQETQEKEIKENKESSSRKETVQELEKELEEETKEINTEVESELKKTSELTQSHQENFGIDPSPSKSKPETKKEKSPEKASSSNTKTEFKPSKNYHSSETTSPYPFSMFPPMFNPMMMPNADTKGGQPMYCFVPVPVDASQMPKDYWQNMSMYYPFMQNMYQPNFNKQNSNSKK